MSKINKARRGRGWLALFIPIVLFDLGLLIFNLIDGKNIALFHSAGLIAQEQRDLMIFVTVILLIAAIPTMFLLYYTAWKYRESNVRTVHDSEAEQKKSTTFVMWAIPTAVMILLAPIMYTATHKLEPKKTIASDAKPITIQVVAMRWKWVFLYPEQQIATVNFVQIPKDTPVTFELTADEAPMSSFWIPNLGGQLYSMTSHVNQLNLIGETIGDYPGSSAELNGAGFAGMKFTTRVSTGSDFESWVQSVKQSTSTLDDNSYKALLKPSEDNPVAVYSSFQNDLYAKVAKKYMGSHTAHSSHETQEGQGSH